MSKFALVEAQRRMAANPPTGMADHVKYNVLALLTLAIRLAHGYELVCCHGCEAGLSYFLREMAPPDDEGGQPPAAKPSKRKGKMAEHMSELFESRLRGDQCVEAHRAGNCHVPAGARALWQHGAATRVMIFSTYRSRASSSVGAAVEGAASGLSDRPRARVTTTRG